MAHKLTPRQYQLAALCASYIPRAEIARRMNLKPRTVDTLLNRLFRRLGISCRRQLAPLLLEAVIRPCHGGGVTSNWGVEPGDQVLISGGRFAGRRGVYLRASNSHQACVKIGGGVFALRARFIERADRARGA